jgi:hypothetical protein
MLYVKYIPFLLTNVLFKQRAEEVGGKKQPLLVLLQSSETNFMFITYPQPNGQVAIVIPTGDVNDAIKDVPAGVEYKIVESVDIDNDYFNAYEFDAELGAKVNIAKAKEIHLDKFRAARAPKLAKLDIDFMKAVEANDEAKKAEIIAAKQALRDVTLTALPDDLAGIKATWPEAIK